MRLIIFGLVSCLPALVPGAAFADPPVSTDPRLAVELVASEPDIVTPIGIAVDASGRVWVIENHTHQRPKDYKGPACDRVRVFDDFDPKTGKARRVRTFADGFQNAMSLALGKDGVVYLATRSDLYRLRDTKNTGVADEREVIVRLDTRGDYPHNGLAGFAFDAQGYLYFGLGENLGEPYRLIGSDKTTLSGGGEGGSVYRCRTNGTGLERLATGFWNPFHMTFDAFGRLWAVDNDPDARGPCRLLHIVRGGDYGYRFRYGRKGLHPFVAWDGELPGTLPMAAGTAEAPSGILAYEAAGFPREYRGQLFVTSWGDHVVERFTTAPHGASFKAQGHILVRGGNDFRPVGIAPGTNGDVYLSDWVESSYPVHGKGRIWRIRPKERAGDGPANPAPMESDVRGRFRALAAASRKALLRGLDDPASEVRGEAARLLGESRRAENEGEVERALLDRASRDASAFVRMQAVLQLRAPASLREVLPMLAEADPYLASAALTVLGRAGNTSLLRERLATADTRLRLGLLLALRRTGDVDARGLVPAFLKDNDPEVRRAAVQWVAEERLSDRAGQAREAALRPPVTRELLQAYLAAEELLAGKTTSNSGEAGQEYVAAIVRDVKYPEAVRALALRMLRPDHPKLNVADLQDYLRGDGGLAREAARALASREDVPAHEALARLAGDAGADPDLRAYALLGLARRVPMPGPTRRLFLESLEHGGTPREVLRSLRGVAGEAPVREAVLVWWAKRKGKPLPPPNTERELAEQVLLLFRGKAEGRLAERLRPIRETAGARPAGTEEWREVLRGPGDPRAGERVFFHPQGPRCSLCHRIDGRGGEAGPDLSRVGAALGRDRLIDSILEPGKEVAPRFTNWMIVTRDGKVRTGVIVGESADSKITVANAQGNLEVLDRTDVEERRALPGSIMPADLHTLMTRQEFRDLLAFLEGRK
jgi:putative membrane-bound dehydrogenase-like protein